MLPDDSFRVDVLLTCTSFCHALKAAPHLLPPVVLFGFPRSALAAADAAQEGYHLLYVILDQLPPSITSLHISADLRDPLPPLLQRLPNLQQLHISGQHGNAAGVGWHSARATPLVPRLSALRLSYHQPDYLVDGDDWDHIHWGPLPSTLPAALAAATQLHALDLSVVWTADAARLLSALPSLQDLSCVARGL
ncbi:hypothetical protein ABPG75_007831 [Micractinium tetrahymenae]